MAERGTPPHTPRDVQANHRDHLLVHPGLSPKAQGCLSDLLALGPLASLFLGPAIPTAPPCGPQSPWEQKRVGIGSYGFSVSNSSGTSCMFLP